MCSYINHVITMTTLYIQQVRVLIFVICSFPRRGPLAVAYCDPCQSKNCLWGSAYGGGSRLSFNF